MDINVGAMYDAWLDRQVDEYMKGCEPEVVTTDRVYEGTFDSVPEYSVDKTYNCEYCDNQECEYWSDYN